MEADCFPKDRAYCTTILYSVGRRVAPHEWHDVNVGIWPWNPTRKAGTFEPNINNKSRSPISINVTNEFHRNLHAMISYRTYFSDKLCNECSRFDLMRSTLIARWIFKSIKLYDEDKCVRYQRNMYLTRNESDWSLTLSNNLTNNFGSCDRSRFN